MKRVAILLLLAAGLVPTAFAQVQVGAYVDYMRLSQTKTNFAGLGARLGVPLASHVKLEAELSYDFEQAFSEGFTNPSTGTVSINRSNLRLLHGLFGPKFELGPGALHPFIVLKGGFLNTRFDSRPATFGNFFSSVNDLRTNNVSAVFYPGVGIEGHAGFLGLRLEVGDEMYFRGGTHNNLRVTFGPFIHF